MLEFLLIILIGSLLVESIVEIISKSGVFLPFREWLANKKNPFLVFISDMMNCPFCLSVWAGWFVAIVLNITIPLIGQGVVWGVVSYFLSGLLLHKIANVIHDIHDRIVYSYDKPDNVSEDQENKQEKITKL